MQGPKLKLVKTKFKVENFIRRLFWSRPYSVVISVQFALEMCVAAKNRHKSQQNLCFAFKVVQGH